MPHKALLTQDEAREIAFDALAMYGAADKGIAMRDLARLIQEANITARFSSRGAADIFDSLVLAHVRQEFSTTDEA